MGLTFSIYLNRHVFVMKLLSLVKIVEKPPCVSIPLNVEPYQIENDLMIYALSGDSDQPVYCHSQVKV